MFDKHGSRTTTEPMIIRLKICSHGQDKTDFFIFLFSQNFAQHCIMQNKPKGTGHPNVFDHLRKIKKSEGRLWQNLQCGKSFDLVLSHMRVSAALSTFGRRRPCW